MTGLRKTLIDGLVHWSTKLQLPRLTAWLLWKSCRFFGPSSARYKVLCIRRSVFVDDLKAVSNASDEFQFAILPKAKLFQVMITFLENDPEFLAKKFTEFGYHQGVCRESMQRYHAYLQKVLPAFLKHWPVDAILVGNFGYREQQELAVVAKEQKIPYVVLFKEGLVVPAHLGWFAETYLNGKRFIGDKILFYSQPIQEATLRSDAFAGCEYETGVTGIPRLDRLAGLSPAEQEKSMVFYSFFPKDKFGSFDCSEETRKKAIEAGDQFHLEVLRFAAANPDWKVVVKTKVGTGYIEYVEQFMEELGETPTNVTITNTADPFLLLCESSWVAAFNSTTLVEALVAGRRILSPDFRDLFPEGGWDYFEHHPSLVNYARSAKEISEVVSSEDPAANSKDFLQQRDDLLQALVNGADGKAGQRVIDELKATIEKKTRGKG